MKKSAKQTTKVKVKDLKPKKSASIKGGARQRVAGE
jgi:hypothetical protein